MAIAPIPASKDTTIPATEEKVYDRWHLASLNINTPDPNKETTLVARFRKGTKDDAKPDGEKWELSNRSEGTTAVLRIPDLQAQGAASPEMEAVMNGVISALIAKGTEAGVL